MSEWKTQKISSLIQLITKGTTPNKAMGGFSEVGINYIKSESISYDGRIDSSKFAFIDEKIHRQLKRSQLQKYDILFSMAGAYLGKSAIVHQEHLPANTNQALAIIRLDQSKANPKFINYFFRHPNVIDYVNNLSGQSAQPNINFEEIKSIEVALPSLSEQKAVASVLSSLDDKIDLLHRQNKTLEAMAETLFRQWFIEEAKEDWEEKKLGTLLTVKRGGSPRPIQEYLSDSGYRWLKISDVTSLNSPFVFKIKEHIKEEGLSKTTLLQAGKLVLSNSATPAIPKILMVDTCIHDGWLHFPVSSYSNEYLYLLFNHIRPELLQLGNGSIFTNLKTDILKEYVVRHPDEDTLLKFQTVIEPIFTKLLENVKQIQTLENLRDTLLPKLMSGEVRVQYQTETTA